MNKYIKSFLKFLIADLGSFGLILIYVCAGALLFQFIEIHSERVLCETGEFLEKKIFKKYGNIMINYLLFKYTDIEIDSILEYKEGSKETSMESLNSSEIDSLVLTNMLFKLRNLVHENIHNYRYTGQNCSEISAWTYPSALLFAFTLVTTIGLYLNIILQI